MTPRTKPPLPQGAGQAGSGWTDTTAGTASRPEASVWSEPPRPERWVHSGARRDAFQKRSAGRAEEPGLQFEALLLDELDVDATAMPDVPDDATDLRMWGMRKGSLASWCTSMRSSLR